VTGAGAWLLGSGAGAACGWGWGWGCGWACEFDCDWDCDELDGGCEGSGWGALEGPWRPRSPGLASGGIRAVLCLALVRVVVGEACTAWACPLAPSVRPGAIAETRAANPAVSAAAAAITHFRARATRRSAESRWSCASCWG
jgi:hypothetical protein